MDAQPLSSDGFDDLSLREDWAIVESMLPQGWQDKARELKAMRRSRALANPATLLRVMLIHLAQGCGLRETAVQARLAGLACMSDVAVLKRLRACGDWFGWMSQGVRQRFPASACAWPLRDGKPRRMRVVDGSTVSEPGPTGSKWRLHYAIGLPDLRCDEVIVSTTRVGETLKVFDVQPGDILMADRCYANPAGVAHVIDCSGDVIVRTNLVTLPLYDLTNQRQCVLSLLRQLGAGASGSWPVRVKFGKRFLSGRLVAVKKSEASAELGRKRVARESQRSGCAIQPQTLEAAGYVFIFTTLGDEVSTQTVLELYRGRWQIELNFKRLKSLVGLGHLKKHDAVAAKAWLQGKLLVAFLTDALLLHAELVSPWGHDK